MRFTQRYLCIFAQEMRIEDQETGRVTEGISVRYIPISDLAPKVDEEFAARGIIKRGEKAVKVWLPIEAKSKLKDFPALYDIDFEMTVGNSNGKEVQLVKVKDINFHSTLTATLTKKV